MKKVIYLLFVLSGLWACNKSTNTNHISNIEENNNPLIEDSLLTTPQVQVSKPVKIQEEDFSIQFPFQPNRDVDSTDLTINYIYANDADTERYSLLYRDFTEKDFGNETEESFLLKAKQGIINSFLPEEISEQKELTLNGYKGFHILAGSPERSFYALRIFLVNRRLYQIIIVKNLIPLTKEEITNFMDSFRLLTKQA